MSEFGNVLMQAMILNAVPALHNLISISPQIAVWQIIFHSDCLLLRHGLGSSFIA
jgi:hypothetical protein